MDYQEGQAEEALALARHMLHEARQRSQTADRSQSPRQHEIAAAAVSLAAGGDSR